MRNASAVVLFQMPRDLSCIANIGKQLFGDKHKGSALLQAHQMAIEDHMQLMNNRWGYLFVDCSMGIPTALRIKTGILPAETGILYYIAA